jgi:hypothetical protein
MRFPWVSRDRYDEMKAMLEQRIAAVEEDRRKILDHLQVQAVGEPIYAKPTPVPAQPRSLEPHETIAETKEQQRVSLVRQAMRATGSKSARVISEWITKHNEKAFHDLMEKPPAAPEDVAMLLDEAVAQGKRAAGVSVA